MTLIVKMNEKHTILMNFELNKNSNKIEVDVVTTISTNYSLIKYLLELIEINSISKNDDGYICLRRKNGKKTSIQQIIMDFYLLYDNDLEKSLKHTEIDHINNIKSNNETSNFQLLTHSDNVLKAKGAEYQVTTENKHIIEVENKIKKLSQYEIDEKYLKRLSGRFKKVITLGVISDINDCCYLDLSSSNRLNQTINHLNIGDDINSIVSYIIDFLTENNAKLIYIMYLNKKRYIVNKILHNNLIVLNRFRSRYKYLDEIIRKYNILDDNYKLKTDLNLYNKIYDYNYQLELYKSKHILLDLYQLIITNDDYTIKDDNILKSLDISFDFNKNGKYYTFRIMYLLGLLKRQKSKRRKSFFSIPVYTEELLKKANSIAKKVLDLKLDKITYFILAEEFGEEIADTVFADRAEKSKYLYHKYSIRAKEDIIKLLKEDKDLYLHRIYKRRRNIYTVRIFKPTKKNERVRTQPNI